ncbi:MAG: PaaI family thioesterase [Desertimonas sp.]
MTDARDVTAHLVEQWSAMNDVRSPRRAALRRLADAGRLLIERMASTDLDDDEAIERAARRIEAVAAELDGPGRAREYRGFAEAANAGGDPHAHFDHSPVIGVANPIAPQSRIELIDERSIAMHVRFGAAYEGPPGSVHGGMLAAAFDELLGMTQSLSGQPGMTGTLSIRYRRPTPLHHDLRFVGRLVGVEGRKIRTAAECYAGDDVTAEAEGVFISVDFAALAQLRDARDAQPG